MKSLDRRALLRLSGLASALGLAWTARRTSAHAQEQSGGAYGTMEHAAHRAGPVGRTSLDAFNPSFDFDIPLAHGRCIPGFGWVAGDYIGIDQGAIFAMIENYRSGMVWNVMHENKYIRHGLDRAGFSGGWLSASK